MKKRNIILFILLSILMCFPYIKIEAQNEKEIIIHVPEKIENVPNEIINTHFKSDSLFSKHSLHFDSYRINPLLNPYSNNLKYNPMVLNYDMSDSNKLSQKLYLIPYNRQITHIGLGDYNNIGVSLKWMPLNRLSIESGVFLSLQYGYSLFSRNVANGYNWGLNYDITTKLQFSIYGQYMMNNSKDPFLNYSNEFPKTNMGTSLQYTPKENSKVGVAMEYQYDEHSQKWKSEAKGKVSIGF